MEIRSWKDYIVYSFHKGWMIDLSLLPQEDVVSMAETAPQSEETKGQFGIQCVGITLAI